MDVLKEAPCGPPFSFARRAWVQSERMPRWRQGVPSAWTCLVVEKRRHLDVPHNRGRGRSPQFLLESALIFDAPTPPFRGIAPEKSPEPMDTRSDETLRPVRALHSAVLCTGSRLGPLARPGTALPCKISALQEGGASSRGAHAFRDQASELARMDGAALSRDIIWLLRATFLALPDGEPLNGGRVAVSDRRCDANRPDIRPRRFATSASAG